MTPERVDAAIAAVGRHDPQLADWMRIAADGLTAGEGEEVISQAGLQAFVWYELPRRYPADAWRPVAEATAVLLTLLGFDRYAAIARSPTTMAVLDAWDGSPAKGFARSRAARSVSGVEPPDTDLLAWGGVFGLGEALARQAVEQGLERAITTGGLQPGRGGWRRAADGVCVRTLLAPAGDGSGRNVVEAILDERVGTWVQLAHPATLRAWRERARDQAIRDVSPSDVEAAVAPMRWLLEACAPGVSLTQAGYLPPAIVREAARRFGWWEWPEQPRTEADVHQVGVLRQTAGAFGARQIRRPLSPESHGASDRSRTRRAGKSRLDELPIGSGREQLLGLAG